MEDLYAPSDKYHELRYFFAVGARDRVQYLIYNTARVKKPVDHILCAVLMLALFSCSGKSAKSDPMYFDFKGYMEKQFSILKESKVGLVKELEFDGIKDKLSVPASGIDWSKELAWFTEIDLNLPAYRSAFDSVEIVAGDHKAVEYYRKDEIKNVPITDAVVRMRDGEVYEIRASILREDLMSTTQVSMIYTTGTGYKIMGRQKTFPDIEHLFEVNGILEK